MSPKKHQVHEIEKVLNRYGIQDKKIAKKTAKKVYKKINEDGGSYIVFGVQFGDEGKGKIVDYLSNKTHAVIRWNGGKNAGHTIKVGDVVYHTHLLPSGIVTDNVLCLIGNGVVIKLDGLQSEINDIESKGIKNIKERLFISNKASVTLNLHCLLDKLMNGHIGTTNQGIGPTYADHASRIGLTINDIVGDLDTCFAKVAKIYDHHMPFVMSKQSNDIDNVKRTQEYQTLYEQDKQLIQQFREQQYNVCDTTHMLNKMLNEGKNVLFEGANAAMLDIDHGTYPYVTSSSCTIGGVLTGSGLSVKTMKTKNIKTIGVFKGYITRVGGGVLPTELLDEIGEILQREGAEFGVTTGRKRRCGWLDLVQLKYACEIDGIDYLNIAKLDILKHFDEIRACVGYVKETSNINKNTEHGFDSVEDSDISSTSVESLESYPADENDLKTVMPVYQNFEGWKDFDISQCKTWEDLHPNIQKYINFIEQYVGIAVKFINTGAERDDMIVRN